MTQRARSRLTYIDWARGLAVLLMIEAHAADAWTRPADRDTIGFRDATILGGFAAPLFLWLAGLGVVLSAERVLARTGNRRAAFEGTFRRGLEIFLLAFLFRLQAFVVSPGSHPITLFRVDILNVMGPGMAAAAVLWVAARGPNSHAWLYSVAGAVVALAAPIVRAAPFVDRLPVWIQWYLRPAGEHTTFTLLPWAGFVFAGAAIGALVAAVRNDRAAGRLHARIAIAGVALIGLGFWTAARPTIYEQSSFWTSSPTWFAIRVGILMVALCVLYSIARVSVSHENTKTRKRTLLFRVFVLSWQQPLARFGRASLFVYWIHVELVYGYASWLWRGRLPLWGTAAGIALFSAVMYGAVVLRDWLWPESAVKSRGPRVESAQEAL